MSDSLRSLFLLGGLVAACSTSAFGQWLTQEVPLRPGWNAIHLQVQPLPAGCDRQWAGVPITEAHRFHQRLRTAQFSTDPSKPFRRPAEWLTWRPDDGTNGFVRTLENLTGDTAYLVYATQSHVWKVTGRPVLPRREWVPGIPNLAGFMVSTGSPPTFAEFFAAEPRIPVIGGPSDALVHDVDADLNGIDLTSKTRRQSMAPGRAYWIRSPVVSSYSGPLSIDTPGALGLVYGDQVRERQLRIRNGTSNSVPIVLRHLPSENPPASVPDAAHLAGAVPLLTREGTPNGGTWKAWSTSETRSNTLAPGGTWVVRLAVNRAAMQPTGSTHESWQSLVQVTGAGMQLHVPVSALYSQTVGSGAPSLLPPGLWVGEASLTHASYALAEMKHSTNPTYVYGPGSTNAPVRQPFPLRLILHQTDGEGGPLQLLSRALLVATNASSATGSTPGLGIFSNESALLARTNLVNVSRISSPGFAAVASLPMPLALNPTNTGVWEGSYTIPLDDPMNPYRHAYHRQHTNGIAITHRIAIELKPNDTAVGGGASSLETVQGVFVQQITGLRLKPIEISGPFQLQRVSPVGQLQ